MTENKLLNSRNKIAGKAVLTVNDYKQLFSIEDFFKVRDRSVITAYFPKFVENVEMSKYSSVMNDLLKKHITTKNIDIEDTYYSFSSNLRNQNKIDIEGYNYMVAFQIPVRKKATGTGYEIANTSHGQKLVLLSDNQNVMIIDLKKKIEILNVQYENNSTEIPQDSLLFKYDDSRNHVKILLTSLSVGEENYAASGFLLFKK